MGIFSDRCEALVNPVTGMALTGRALEEARKNPSWPRCGNSVAKSAKFCNVCGAPARGGWVKCPHCGETVGNDSNFCWNCHAALHPTDGCAMAGGVWHREPGVFAQRFENESIKGQGDHDLQVQEGSAAILLSAGAVEDVLDAGRFNTESKARKLNWFGDPPKRSAILVESGETIFPLSFSSLPTKATQPGRIAGPNVDFYGEIVLQFGGDRESGRRFVANFFKDSRELSFADVVRRFSRLFEQSVKAFCAEATLDELMRGSDSRLKLRDRMTQLAEEELAAVGLVLVRVSSAEFDSDYYAEQIMANAKTAEEQELAAVRYEREQEEAERKRLELERKIALEELEAKAASGAFKSEQELRQAKEAAEHECRMDEARRQAEWDALNERLEAERQKAREQRELERQEMSRRSEEEQRQWRQKCEAEDRLMQEAQERADKARREQEEADERARAAAEKERRQKEEDADRIRKWAILEDELTHQWSQEVEQLEHDETIAAAVRRADEARRTYDWDMAVRQLAHDLQLDETKTKWLIQKAEMVRRGELTLKQMQDDYEFNRKIEEAKTLAAVSAIQFDTGLVQRKQNHEQGKTELVDLLEVEHRKAEFLLDRIERTADPKTKQLLQQQYEKEFLRG